jgi:uncharacterized membrane protein YcaP (DUF421 family)
VDPGRIAIRAVFAYLFLFALIRTSGKRTVAQGTVFDFVIALILGDMIDDLLWAEVPASQFVVATGVLVLVHLSVEIVSSKSKLLSRFVGGSSLMFLRNGSLLKAALRREQMNEKEADAVLRLKGLQSDRWREVKSAWIEKNGRPAVLRKEWSKAAQQKDQSRLRRHQS